MIGGINTSNSAGYLHIDPGYGGNTYISPNSNNPMTGMIRMNGSTLEAFDGSCWVAMAMNYPSVSLNQTAIQALDWCQRKMIEEAKIKELAAKSPTVQDALDAYNDAKSKLEVVLTLTDQA